MTEQPQARRRSFDEVLQDSLAQWTKRFERALEEQRQVIGTEAQQRSSDIARLTLEQLEALEQVAQEKVAELEQIAVDYREANERVLSDQTSEVERATRKQVDASVDEVSEAFDKFAGKRLDELENSLRARLEAFRRELVDETNRARAVGAEQLNETRSMVTSETRQLEEQVVVAQDELRRVAAKETASFDELARERISDLRDLLSNQTELLAEFTRTNESTSQKIDEQAARAKDEIRRVAANETTSFTASFDGLARERISELQDLLSNQTELLAEFTSTHEAAINKLEEQAATAQDEIRLVAANETTSFTTSFDGLSRERISRLQELLGDQTELLAEFTSTHEATSNKFEEARSFTDDTMARLSKLNEDVTRLARQNEESTAAAAQGLKQASAIEINSIQQRAMVMKDQAAKLTSDFERRAEGLLEAEASTAEGLQQFEQQLEARRAEIESLVEERVGGLTDQVRQAEASAVRRIGELGGRADAKLGEQKQQLESTRTAMQNEFREIRRADAAAIQAVDTRMAKLVEMLAATQVALDTLTERVQDLEIVAGEPAPYTPAADAPALDERVPSDGQPAIDPPPMSNGADIAESGSDGADGADGGGVTEPPSDEPVSAGPPARVPRPDPASTPDLREW